MWLLRKLPQAPGHPSSLLDGGKGGLQGTSWWLQVPVLRPRSSGPLPPQLEGHMRRPQGFVVLPLPEVCVCCWLLKKTLGQEHL